MQGELEASDSLFFTLLYFFTLLHKTMRRRIIIAGSGAGPAGLGAYAPASTVPMPDYRGREAEGASAQQQPSVPPSSQPPVKPPPSSGAVYVPQQPWVTPPADAEFFDPIDYVALGNQGTTTVILTLNVPMGRDGVIELFGNVVFGAGWTEGTGDLIWQILKNGEAVRNYENIRASLGNVSNPVALGLRIAEGDQITVQVVNAAAPAGVPGNPITSARFHGWFYPKAHDTQGWA